MRAHYLTVQFARPDAPTLATSISMGLDEDLDNPIGAAPLNALNYLRKLLKLLASRCVCVVAT
jgi:hypothetical protein